MNPLDSVHRTPFFSALECDDIVRKACATGGWRTHRHKFYPTTDIPLDRIDGLDMGERVAHMGQLCMQMYGLSGRAVPFDLFVVKYETGAQDSLAMHRDASELSFVALLSDPCDFEGGGTLYERTDSLVKLGKGEVVFHCGKGRHAGCKITRGRRFVLIGFFDVQSPSVRKSPAGETVGQSISDRRHLDYLYKHEVSSRYNVHVRVINILDRSDKLRAILKKIDRIDVPTGWNMDVQVVVADEGGTHTGYPEWVTHEDLGLGTHRFWTRPITSGEVGCFVSHMRTLQNVTLTSNELLLVLEDDACFYSDLFYRIDRLLAHDTEVVDLGGVCMGRGFHYQTHCILYTSSAIAKLGDLSYTGRVIPFDEFVNILRGVHPRKDLQALWADAPSMNVVQPPEQLSWQGGDVHDTEPSPNIFARVSDDYDMLNYYVFASCNHDVAQLIKNANKNMWKFQVSGVKRGQLSEGWKIHMTASVKIVAAVLGHNGRVEFQHNGRVIDKGVVIFPAYLSVRIVDADLHYGFGEPFY